jgi:hypothetical protein
MKATKKTTKKIIKKPVEYKFTPFSEGSFTSHKVKPPSYEKPIKDMTITERWENGVPHDPRSVAIVRGIAEIDFNECNDTFCWKYGGDGDNGETLMYELDIFFTRNPNWSKNL